MRTVQAPVRYAVARGGEQWPEVTLAGLETDPGGDLHLQLVPGVNPAVNAAPADAAPSGLALDCRCGLYLSDATDDEIIRLGLDCGGELLVPGAAGTPGLSIPQSPQGLCWGPGDWLFAGCGDGRVLVLTTPDLHVRDVWEGFQDPAYLAAHRDWVLVVDVAARSLSRCDARGNPDIAFNDTVASASGLVDPRGIAVSRDGTIYVADAAGGAVLSLSWSGAPGTSIATGIQPRAVAIGGGILYVADAASGRIFLHAIPDGRLLGAVGGFQAPVSALAVGDDALFIKEGAGASYLTAPLASSYIPSGTLTMGPLDAGTQTWWSRAEAVATLLDLTDVQLAWYTDTTPTPVSITWTPAPSLDLLIDGERYLWLQVTASSRDPSASPTLTQVGAQTAGDSYLAYLPYVYSHDPEQSGLSALTLSQASAGDYEPGDLEYLRLSYARNPRQGNQIGRLVDLARTQLGGIEATLDALPRSFDPGTAPAGMLEWLAGWLAFRLPPHLQTGRHPDEVRRLLLALASLYRRRGTARGLADFVEVYAGVRPHVLEDFRERPMWIVGETPLGFGTGMPERDVEGMLVGEAVVGAMGPEDPTTIGSALFASTAHRFSLIVPPPARTGEMLSRPSALERDRAVIMQVVEEEKPAHTGFHICYASPRMRVGIQARVGIDALVAEGPATISLGETSILDGGTVLGGPAPGDAAVGSHGLVGIDMRLS